MAWRRVVAEYEADLYQVPVPKIFKFPKGEAEYKEYSDGERKFEISLWGLKIPDGSMASIRLNDQAMFEVQIQRGRAKLDLASNEATEITDVQNGDVIKVYYNSDVLLEGTFKPDD